MSASLSGRGRAHHGAAAAAPPPARRHGTIAEEIALATSAVFAHLRCTLVASGRTVGRQLSLPPSGHSCSCLTHSFGFAALLAATLADAPCALFACRRYPTARPRSTGDDGR